MILRLKNWKSRKGRKSGRELNKILRIKNHLIKCLIGLKNGKRSKLCLVLKRNNSQSNKKNNKNKFCQISLNK